MSIVCDISYSTFQNFHSSENGGVFSIFQGTVKIECCYFLENSSPLNGGSCYIENGFSALSKVSFMRSFSAANSEQSYGNAVYVNGGNVSLNCIETCQCGISREQSTDTSIALHFAARVSVKYNATSNYGNNGGSGFNIHSPPIEPTVRFVSVVTAYDFRFIEFGTVKCNIEQCNFINSTVNNDAVIQVADKIVIGI